MHWKRLPIQKGEATGVRFPQSEEQQGAVRFPTVTGGDPSVKRRAGLFIALLCLLALGCVFVVHKNGLSPLESPALRSVIGESYDVLHEADLDWGRLYLLKTPDGYRTVLRRRAWLGWAGSYSMSAADAPDEPLVTIGHLSIGFREDPRQQITFFAVEVRDRDIAFVEAGPLDARTKSPVPDSRLVLFRWDRFPLDYHEFDPVALSADGRVLFRYGVVGKEDGSIHLPDDLKWYSLEASGSDNSFDARQAEVGDKVADLGIVRVSDITERSENDYSASVAFSGEVTLSGTYHCETEEEVAAAGMGGSPEVHLFVDDECASSLPKIEGDIRSLHFVFSNYDEALQAFGPPGRKGRATVVIDDYVINFFPSCAGVNRARLVRVVPMPPQEDLGVVETTTTVYLPSPVRERYTFTTQAFAPYDVLIAGSSRQDKTTGVIFRVRFDAPEGIQVKEYDFPEKGPIVLDSLEEDVQVVTFRWGRDGEGYFDLKSGNVSFEAYDPSR